eukprot:CAMPEP_0168346326 /NCGR_PEP_ID=MMETSP0213-20121227/18184_1 /TAXON_ID=151035 /ORGANISM="Euplotes harpa, Strain FSP1.4" /LENGTH=294 /DNA_ID=CAMNT_0008354915 /DNA_START=221 /DNA_END=1104 /DNA_ORIENTATION=+
MTRVRLSPSVTWKVPLTMPPHSAGGSLKPLHKASNTWSGWRNPLYVALLIMIAGKKCGPFSFQSFSSSPRMLLSPSRWSFEVKLALHAVINLIVRKAELGHRLLGAVLANIVSAGCVDLSHVFPPLRIVFFLNEDLVEALFSQILVKNLVSSVIQVAEVDRAVFALSETMLLAYILAALLAAPRKHSGSEEHVLPEFVMELSEVLDEVQGFVARARVPKVVLHAVVRIRQLESCNQLHTGDVFVEVALDEFIDDDLAVGLADQHRRNVDAVASPIVDHNNLVCLFARIVIDNDR